MAGYKIQANYDFLQSAMQKFSQRSDEINQLQSTVNRVSGQLQSGDWIGQGAEKFFQEMNDLVTPGMKRLISVLKDASEATKRISDALREAEESAGALFRGGNGGGGAHPKPGNVPAPTTNVSEAGSGVDADAFDDRRLPYKVGSPTEVANYAFASGNAPALKYQVEIGGKTIDVYYPKNVDPTIGKTHTIDQVAKGLAALPESSRNLITKVQVNPGKNPDDAYWATKYKDFAGSYMTAGKEGTVNVYPTKTLQSQSYLDGTMIHETGHILSQQKWGTDYSGADWQKWTAAGTADGNQVSTYGNNSPGEDFSEALQQYMTYKGTKYEADARKLWPNRFAIIDNMVK